jgi:predicted nucleic acid-binding protein
VSMDGRHATSANDCSIATYAIFRDVPLLHHDRDFNLIAGAEPKLILVGAGN